MECRAASESVRGEIEKIPSGDRENRRAVYRLLALYKAEMVELVGLLPMDIEIEEALRRLRMNVRDIVLEKLKELHDICWKSRVDVESHMTVEGVTRFLDSGADPSQMYETIECEIMRRNEEYKTRRPIIEKADNCFAACKEQRWLEGLDKEESRHSLTRESRKRARRARVEGIRVKRNVLYFAETMQELKNDTRTWEREEHRVFLYRGTSLLKMLQSYDTKKTKAESFPKMTLKPRWLMIIIVLLTVVVAADAPINPVKPVPVIKPVPEIKPAPVIKPAPPDERIVSKEEALEQQAARVLQASESSMINFIWSHSQEQRNATLMQQELIERLKAQLRSKDQEVMRLELDELKSGTNTSFHELKTAFRYTNTSFHELKTAFHYTNTSVHGALQMAINATLHQNKTVTELIAHVNHTIGELRRSLGAEIRNSSEHREKILQQVQELLESNSSAFEHIRALWALFLAYVLKSWLWFMLSFFGKKCNVDIGKLWDMIQEKLVAAKQGGARGGTRD